ncbi:GerAB/ArcD/ProY family transporter [Brevibacillus thermoruber]|uniref:GerAB/ArcD/ProY family transporter n=1 Tax=Brevibacillus thermoruber TaxID=33942 RepID=UPI0004008077|nr:GerAB/ArcD/ProY family transporter [Brevibacillus thermoruber]
MKSSSLFAHDKPLQPWMWAVLVNRMQVGYFMLILPNVLVQPYMVWIILLAGCLALLNLWVIGKGLEASYQQHETEGWRPFMGSVWMRVLMVPCLVIMLLKLTIVVKGYVGIVHQILFPSVNTGTFIVLMMFAGYYLAKHGMWTVLRFGVIAFLMSAWILVLYGYFLLPPEANYSHLYPIIPLQWPSHWLESLLFVWAAFAGPEYFVVLGPWTGGKPLTKYFLAGHVVSLFEYVYFFFVSLLFFGSPYLKTVDIALIQLVRYIQLPFFERVEMIVVPAYMAPVVLVIALLMLYVYGALRILLKRIRKPPHAGGLFMVFLAVGGYLLIVDRWLWTSEIQRRMWEQLQMVVGGASFALTPALFLVLHAMQSRRRKSEKAQ